jgi:hypothetical protein
MKYAYWLLACVVVGYLLIAIAKAVAEAVDPNHEYWKSLWSLLGTEERNDRGH